MALSALPAGLRGDLLDAFQKIVRNYRERRWEPAELNGGKLCEAAYSIVDGYLNGGQYPARASKPQRFNNACLDLEKKYPKTDTNHSARILIPRRLIGLYDIRNNRGVGHAGGDVDPNQMDATVVLYEAKWLVAELIRLLHTLTTDEATAVVDALVQREVAWVWSNADLKRVLRLGLTWRQQTLTLLLSETGAASVADLMRWLEHPAVKDYRRVLRQMHAHRLVEFDEARQTVFLLPPGIDAAEKLVASL
ncbi:MAG: hypothetical protein WD269_00420 [Acidimicrobiia bacterium]